MGLFVDLIELSERQTNAGLEALCKAGHEHGDDSEIWAEHPNPAIRRLIELFTQRGLMRLDGFRQELEAWLTGKRHTHAGTTMPRPDGAMERWTPEQLGLVKLYLETLPPERWTIDDHMMMVDYLVQRWLPADDMRAESEWLATRATLMGRVQASMATITVAQADKVLAALPLTVAAARGQFQATPLQAAVLDFARVRAAENVRQVTEDVRHRMRVVVAQHIEQQQLRIPAAPGSSLQTKLNDEFATLNRDWRRVAVTEAGEAQTQGQVASTPPGRKLKRVEQYKGVCAFCAKIDGRIVEVVEADRTDKDGETMIWAGKSNIGRSASPRKRVGNLLVEREPHEMWWIPAGLAHPHCRGRYLPVMEDQPGDDPDFGAWLRATLEKK